MHFTSLKKPLLFILLCIPSQAHAFSLNGIWRSVRRGLQSAYSYVAPNRDEHRNAIALSEAREIIEAVEEIEVIPDEEEIIIVEEETCAICFDSLHAEQSDLKYAPFTYTCNRHSFHTACIHQWTTSGISTSNNCPICRHHIGTRKREELSNLALIYEWHKNRRFENQSREEQTLNFIIQQRKSQVEVLQDREINLLKQVKIDPTREISRLRDTHNQLNNQKRQLQTTNQHLTDENRQLKKILFIGTASVITVSTLAIGWYSRK